MGMDLKADVFHGRQLLKQAILYPTVFLLSAVWAQEELWEKGKGNVMLGGYDCFV